MNSRKDADCLLLILVVLIVTHVAEGTAQEPRFITVELYLDPAIKASHDIKPRLLESFGEKRIIIYNHFLDTDEERNRLDKISRYYKLQHTRLPLLFTCNGVVNGQDKTDNLIQGIKDLLRVDIFTKNGCLNCKYVPDIIKQINKRYPAMLVSELNVEEAGPARTKVLYR